MSINRQHLTRMIDTKCREFQGYLYDQGVNAHGIYSDRATAMLLATAAHESHAGEYFYQIGGGPGRGIFSMEITQDGIIGTEESIWTNWLKYRLEWRVALTRACGVIGYCDNGEALVYNLAYQIVMARIYYWQVPKALPGPYMLDEQMKYWADYWKRTDVSIGDEVDFISDCVAYLG